MRIPVELELEVPPSPEAMDLQYKYFPPKAVKQVDGKENEVPVAIFEFGSEYKESPIHHSELTLVELLKDPGEQVIETELLDADIGIFEMIGRATFTGGVN